MSVQCLASSVVAQVAAAAGACISLVHKCLKQQGKLCLDQLVTYYRPFLSVGVCLADIHLKFCCAKSRFTGTPLQPMAVLDCDYVDDCDHNYKYHSHDGYVGLSVLGV